MNDLKDTQVMSNDQLKKLYNLENKQDLLEVGKFKNALNKVMNKIKN